MFFRNRLRHWTARVLFAWLFGIAVGAANACLVEQAVSGEAAHSSAAAAAHHDEEGHPNCLDYCEASNAVVAAPKSAPDPVDAAITPPVHVALPLPVDGRYTSIEPTGPAQRGAVPIPISFLRLAL